jgi:hypothetical protein
MANKEPRDKKPLSLPKTIVLVLMVIALGLYGATHLNNPLSALMKMMLVP